MSVGVAQSILFVALMLSVKSEALLRLCGILLAVSGLAVITLLYLLAVLLPESKAKLLLKKLGQVRNEGELAKLRRGLTGDAAEFVNKISIISQKEYRIEESKRQAEYLALQSQINPHFLYNTLEAIRGDALSSGMSAVSEMTEALGTFFRYSVSGGQALVTLEDELGNVENYFLIQRYRFGDRLSYAVRNEDNVLDCAIPKLTLQPIIENAIYHGIECKLGPGRIDIIIEPTQSRLIINVIDDGVGIGEDTLNYLNGAMNPRFPDMTEEGEAQGNGPGAEAGGPGRVSSGIGLINVNNRIKLIFGDDYGLRISSALGVGTDVEITLPLKK